MSVSSAEPQKLKAFVDNTRPGRTSASDERRSVASLQANVRAASPDFGVDIPVISALAGRLSSMHDNERFVSTIRTELLAADHHGGGPITVSNATLRAALDAAGVGTPPPRLRFEPSSMYGLPPTSGFVDDPICAANGNMVHQDVDLVFPGIAASLDLSRTYNSLLTERVGVFGAGWTSVLDVRLAAGDGRVEIDLPDGATVAFVRLDDGGWAAAGRRVRGLERTDSGWRVAVDDLREFRFDDDGHLIGWSVGTSTVDIERGDHNRIVRVSEQRSGRSYSIEWTEQEPPVVARVVSNDGRAVEYRRDGDRRLTRASSAAGHLDYEWHDGFLTAVVDADGVRPFRNEYDSTGRVTRQTSPFGRVTDYRYETDGLTVITDEHGVRQAMVHDARGNLTAVIDTDGSAMRLTYDHLDRAVEVTDKAGATWAYRFDDDDDRLVERIDPDGLSEAWSWDSAGRVTRHTARNGAVTSYEYRDALRSPVRITGPSGEVSTAEIDDDLDLPVVVIDADGVITRFEYDADGQAVAAIDALGGRTTFSFDAAGRVAGYHDAVGVATVLTHDRGGRLVRHERGSAITTYSRTAAGRIDGGSEPGAMTWSASFGRHGAPVTVADALGSTLRFEYDSMGNVTDLVAPDGAVYHHEYDEVGRLAAVIDPAGGVTRRAYDGAGHVVAYTDPAGRTARREVDVFGRTVLSVAPDGGETRFTYHPNGEVATVTGPDGRTWRTELDLTGRVVAITNPAGATAGLEYTACGRLALRRSPAGRIERYEYDLAGRRVAIVDAAGVRHAFQRDERGRMVAVERQAPDDADVSRIDLTWDALGHVAGYSTPRTAAVLERDSGGRVLARTDGAGARTEYEWDARGLLVGATDPAGGQASYGYDVRGRLTAQTMPGGRSSTWSYDGAGRVASTTDPMGVITEITRDPAGFVTGISRGGDGWSAELDSVGRQVRRTAFDGSVLGEYRYDGAGRIAEASAPNGWSTSFLWDDDDNLSAVLDVAGTTLIERDADGWAVAMTQPDGVRTLIDRDPTGRIIGIRDDEAGAASTPTLLGEFAVAGRLALGPDGTAYRYDDAGRLAEIATPDGDTVGYEYGDDGLIAAEHRQGVTRRFGYDAAGRVTSIAVDGGLTSHFSYDDSGRRSREVRSDGTVLEFRWSGLDRLVEIVRTAPSGERVSVSIEVDAVGRPRRVGGHEIEYDPLSALPSRIDDVRLVNAPGFSWRSDERTWSRTTPGVAEGLTVGSLTFLGARVLDQSSHQFLSPDPLPTVPGTNGGTSAYTYAWSDPVNYVDPSGMRPISQEDWDAIREREESGRLGQAWDVIREDPWGSIAAGAVIVTGAVLCFTPLAPIGAGILIGAAVSAGTGFATGNLDPRQVALSGVLGGVSGGAGALGWGAARSVALGVGVGAGGDLGSQLIQGGPIDWGSVAVNGAIGGVSGGIGQRLGVTSPNRSAANSALTGAATDGGGSVVRQALTGDHTIDINEVAFDAAGGAANSVVGDHFGDRFSGDNRTLDPQPLQLSAGPQRLALPPGPGPDMVTVYRRTDLTVELQIHQETGLILSDAARRAYMGTGGDLDVAHAYSASAHDHATRVWGSENDYVQAHGAFGTEITSVSGDRSMISVTTDPEVAARFGGKHAVTFQAEVPRDSLIPQTLPDSNESELLAPHSIRMTPVSD